MNTTLKTTTVCDYLVYLDKDMLPVGFELTIDERQALSLRYHTSEVIIPCPPKSTRYMLEVFGVNTTLIWMMAENHRQGELLFYGPNMIALTRETTKSLSTAIKKEDYKFASDTDKEKIKLLEFQGDRLLEKIVKSLPFPNWMNIYWNTPIWMEIWKARPDLQPYMIEYNHSKTS